MANNTIEYNLPQNAYATFDAQSIRDLIIGRLNEGGVFTDQNYVGSNLNTIIEIISVAYGNLIYYLNQQSSESLFSQAQIYENMNKIVKLLGYNPIGLQTATLSFKSINSGLSTGVYIIPRYSYFNVGGTYYSFPEDTSFSAAVSGSQNTSLDNNYVLYQGIMTEYPAQTATGEPFEQITLTSYNKKTGERTLIDHFNIDVYVLESDGRYYQYEQTQSLFLETAGSRHFELRFNELGNYEIKFGDNVNGRKLNGGETILVYYLKSDGATGAVGVGSLDGTPIVSFNTTQFNAIMAHVGNVSYMTYEQMNLLEWSNTEASTDVSAPETLEQIRTYAPKAALFNNRLITIDDFESFVNREFSAYVSSIKAVNNNTMLEGHMNYLSNIHADTLNDAGLLEAYNLFYNGSSFNNIYIYAVPAAGPVVNKVKKFLVASQKTAITTAINKQKMETINPVIIDPVYISVAFGLGNLSTTNTVDDIVSNTYIEVAVDKNVRRDISTVQKLVVSYIEEFFNYKNITLGYALEFTTLVSDILSINGVLSVTTKNGTLTREGLCFAMWNDVYPDKDVIISDQNITLPYYKFPFLSDSDNISSKVTVILK